MSRIGLIRQVLCFAGLSEDGLERKRGHVGRVATGSTG